MGRVIIWKMIASLLSLCVATTHCTLMDAATLASQKVGGRVVAVDLLRDENQSHWSVDVLRGNRVHVVEIDPESRKVIRTLTVKEPRPSYAWTKPARVGVNQAAFRALRWKRGTVIEAELETFDKGRIWEIDIVDPKGKKHEALVDAVSGAVIGVD